MGSLEWHQPAIQHMNRNPGKEGLFTAQGIGPKAEVLQLGWHFLLVPRR